MMAVNYRNEPVGLRVRNPGTNSQAAGLPGDLSFAYQSRTDRADTAFNVQPTFYPPLTTGLTARRSVHPPAAQLRGGPGQGPHAGGGHEEPHNFTIHGREVALRAGRSGLRATATRRWRASPSGSTSRSRACPASPTASPPTSSTSPARPPSRSGPAPGGSCGSTATIFPASPSVTKFALVPLTAYNPAASRRRRTRVFATHLGQPGPRRGRAGRRRRSRDRPCRRAAGTATPAGIPSNGGTRRRRRRPSRSPARPTPPSTAPTRSPRCRPPRSCRTIPSGCRAWSTTRARRPVSGPAGTFSGPLYDPTAILFVFTSDLTYVGHAGAPAAQSERPPRAAHPARQRGRMHQGDAAATTSRPSTPTAGVHRGQHDRRGLQPERRRALAGGQPPSAARVLRHPAERRLERRPQPDRSASRPPGRARRAPTTGTPATCRAPRPFPIEFGATGLTSADPIKHSNKGLMGSLIIEPATRHVGVRSGFQPEDHPRLGRHQLDQRRLQGVPRVRLRHPGRRQPPVRRAARRCPTWTSTTIRRTAARRRSTTAPSRSGTAAAGDRRRPSPATGSGFRTRQFPKLRPDPPQQLGRRRSRDAGLPGQGRRGPALPRRPSGRPHAGARLRGLRVTRGWSGPTSPARTRRRSASTPPRSGSARAAAWVPPTTSTP